MRFSLLTRFLSLQQECLQLRPVGGDHLQLRLRSLDDHRHLVGVGTDQSLAPLKLGDGPHLAAGELQGFLDRAGLVRLQVQDDFVLGVVDDGPAVLAVLQAKEVGQVLGGCDSSPTKAPDDLEDFQTELRSQTGGAGADQLPNLVDEDGFPLGAVRLDLVPHIIQGDEHAHGEQLAFQLAQVQHDILVAQVHVGLPVEGLSRPSDKPADNGCQTLA